MTQIHELYIAVTQALETEEEAYPVINDLVRKTALGPLPMVFLYKEEAGYVVWRRVTEDDVQYCKDNPETRKWKAAWKTEIPGEQVADY
jgi:hypothetical protein